MKIAILSMQRIVNFGSVLQAYSLREILRELTGAQVSFLDIAREPALPSRKTVSDKVDYEEPAAYPPGILQRGKRWIIARLSAKNKRLIRAFMEKELGLNADANAQHYDCVIVGSDEVFNHKNGVCLQLHGDIRQAERLFTYAASCGSAVQSDIAEEDLETVRAAMNRFSAMSVRDAATENYVSGLYHGNVVRHLDPVLVGNLNMRDQRPVPLKNYLLVYAYGQRIRTKEEIDAIRAFAKKKGLKTVAIGGSQFWCDLYLPVSPMRMLDYFHYADYVVTDTFHGTIFSVISRKQFAVISRKTNRAKIGSLLQDLRLTDRLISKTEELEQVLIKPVSYEQTDEILSEERRRTREYLKSCLNV